MPRGAALNSAIAQKVLLWTGEDEAPKKSDKAWIAHVCSVALAGEGNKARRPLFKAQADAVRTFVNWLTHSTSSNWHDAEAAVAATEPAPLARQARVNGPLCGIGLAPQQSASASVARRRS